MFLSVSMGIVIISMALLSALVQQYPVILWPCSALLGIGYGTIIPSSFLWVSSFMTIDGLFSSSYWVGSGIGSALIPTLMGYLMDTFDPMWFSYVLLACAIGMTLTYVVICILVRCRPTSDIDSTSTVVDEKI